MSPFWRNERNSFECDIYTIFESSLVIGASNSIKDGIYWTQVIVEKGLDRGRTRVTSTHTPTPQLCQMATKLCCCKLGLLVQGGWHTISFLELVICIHQEWFMFLYRHYHVWRIINHFLLVLGSNTLAMILLLMICWNLGRRQTWNHETPPVGTLFGPSMAGA